MDQAIPYVPFIAVVVLTIFINTLIISSNVDKEMGDLGVLSIVVLVSHVGGYFTTLILIPVSKTFEGPTPILGFMFIYLCVSYFVEFVFLHD